MSSEERGRPDPSITVAIPLYNEESTAELVVARVASALKRMPRGSHEILCVDDGSNDATLETLLRLRDEYSGLRIISLSRNFGHQAALSAALDAATGDVVFIMDGDLQDDPDLLPEFVDEYLKGADVVYATRATRSGSLWLRAAYSLHYRLLAFLSDTPIPVDAGDFSLLSKKAVDLLTSMPERQRYLRGMRAWIGLDQVEIRAERRERAAGASKYSFGDLLKLSFDGLFAFSVIPLRIASVVGAITVLIGVGYGIFALYDRLTGGPPEGFATLALLQILFSGVVLLVLGVIGEYIGRIYEEVKRRPVYVVADQWEPRSDDG